MTRQDTYRVLGILRSYYPSSFAGSDDEERLRLTLWQRQFADEPATLVQAAVEAYVSIDKKGFMPVPGQIKEQIRAGQSKCKAEEAAGGPEIFRKGSV